MALFGFGKDRKDGAIPEQVMAYLEDAQRVRCPFTLVDGRKAEYATTLAGIDEEAGTLSFQLAGPFLAEKGAKLELGFLFEGLRLAAATRLVEVRPGSVVVEIPGALELRERRKQARARLNLKEGATLTGLSSLFEGVGITGLVENLSERGLRVRVERAMNIKDQGKLPLGSVLVKPGHVFMVLKLSKLPRCPAVVETAGKVVYVESSSAGLFLGLELDSSLPGAVKGMISSRAGSLATSLPARSRRRPVVEEAPAAPRRPEPVQPRAEAAPAASEPSPAPAASQVAPSEPVPDPAPEAAVAPEENPEAGLARLKKRSRAVVLLPADLDQGGRMRSFLLERGYARIMIAAGLDHLRTCLQQPNVGLLFLDGGLPVQASIALLHDLEGSLQALPPTVLAAEDVSQPVVLAAIQAGASQLVVKPYELDEDLAQMLDQVFLKG